MAINVIVQYNGGFLSDILLLTQAPIFVYGSMALLLSYVIIITNITLALNYVPGTTLSSVLLCLVALHGD